MLLGNKSYKNKRFYGKDYNDSYLTAIATDFNSLLKYFRQYWKTMKIFARNIVSNEIIANKNFPGYGTYTHTYIYIIYMHTYTRTYIHIYMHLCTEWHS